MLKLADSSVSVVVLAREHNPTILHPSFLRSQHIVGEDFELALDPICTPAISVIQYKNGISFVVEGDKFQVLDSMPGENIKQSIAPQLAYSYIEKLPHVQYQAVGLNIKASISIDDPSGFIVSTYIKEGPWNEPELPLQDVRLKLNYPMKDALLRLSIYSNAFTSSLDEHEEVNRLVVAANYHIKLTDSSAMEEAKRAIWTFPERCDHYFHILENKIALDLEKATSP